jgi:uncharacterized protein
MGKLLILALVAVVAYLLWRGLRRGADSPPRQPPADGERMVDCSQCGVHLPVSEAIAAQGRYFCSDEHRRLHRT